MYSAAYPATYNPEYVEASSFDKCCCFNVAASVQENGQVPTKTTWHQALDAQHKAFTKLFGDMYKSGSEQLGKSIGTSDEQGKSTECRIGYSSSNHLDTLKKKIAPSALQECSISEDALVVYAVQRAGFCDLSPDGILLPGITQIITISHGYALVRDHGLKVASSPTKLRLRGSYRSG